jgi:hypothetical protein
MDTDILHLYCLPIAYDGDGDGDNGNDGDGDKGGNDDKPKVDPNDPAVKALLEAERQKARENQEKVLKELEHLKKTSNLNSDQRKKLDQRLEVLQNELLTTKEQAERQATKAKQEHEAALTTAQQQRDEAVKKYEDLRITNELIGAATEYKAYNPDQVISQVRGNTHLRPVLDDDGNETGEVAVVVDIVTKDSEGKEVTLSVPPKDAIKRMSEDEKHANLFVAQGEDGLGFRPSSKSGSMDLATAASDPARYRELRKAGKI